MPGIFRRGQIPHPPQKTRDPSQEKEFLVVTVRVPWIRSNEKMVVLAHFLSRKSSVRRVLVGWK